MRSTVLAVATAVTFPLTAWAGVATVENVAVSVQPIEGGSFQLLFKFDLPQLPDSVKIDYAVLTFALNLASTPNGRFLEILAADATGKAPESKVAYNQKPVTGLVPRDKTGLVRMKLDITQLVDLWQSGKAKNRGVLVVSHRREESKALRSEVVSFASEQDAKVKISYTERK